MDIIKANKCLCHWYGPLNKGKFNNLEVGAVEGEPTQLVSPKEALKARVAAYTKTIEEAAQAAAVKVAAAEAAAAEAAVAEAAVAEAAPAEGAAAESVVIP